MILIPTINTLRTIIDFANNVKIQNNFKNVTPKLHDRKIIIS